MTSLRFPLASALTLALLLGPSFTPAFAKDPPGWPQETGDIRPDPQVRFGRLANGMRYALMHNATPTGQASFRLRFAAGSLMETEAQQGLAHFLEHMAFNGSTHVPGGDMVKILERLGLAFGADTNASTDWTETVYKLDLPKSDAGTVDTSLMLLREVASELAIAQPSMDRERGVVLSEERQSDTPSYRAFVARMGFFLPGQLVSHRLPIGKVKVIQTADRSQIEDIYQKYYRPDRATFIAVGDFDVDAMEAKVKARFGDWTNPHPEGSDPDLGAPAKRGLESDVYVEPGLQTSLQIGWIQPPDLSADSLAKRRRDMVDRLALAVLDRRLERIARGGSPPFLTAGASTGDESHSARVTELDANANGGDWRAALDAVVGEEQRLVRYGVLQGELDREIQELRVALKARIDAAATRRTPALASGLVASLDDRLIFTDPAQDLAIFESEVRGLRAAEVSDAARRMFQGAGPLVFLAAAAPVQGGKAAVTNAFQAAVAAPVQPPAIMVDKTWPYDRFGQPGQVVERRPAPSVGATFIRFANGVRLTVKPTDFRKDQVLVQVRVGQGRMDMPRDRPNAQWARSAFIEGGLKKVTAEELEQIMTSKIVGANFSVDDDAYVLSAATRPADLDTQMQLLAAYLTDPGFRPEAFDRVKTYGLTLEDQLDATPGGVIGRDLGALIRGGDQRWAFPPKAVIAASTPQDLKAMIANPLAAGQIEVVVVGDITVDQAITQVSATFGALPPRVGETVDADARKIAFPAPTADPLIRTHKGRADQAVAVAAWPTTDLFADVQGARAIRVMVNIIQLRLIDSLRVAQGATYSPSASLEASEDYPGYGYVAASVEIPPAKIAGFYDEVAKIASDLRANAPSPDEIKRAVLPRIEAIGKAMQTNEYWLAGLAEAQTDPRRLSLLTDQIPQLEKVTAEDVRKAAQRWLDPSREWKFEVLPESATAVASARTTQASMPQTQAAQTPH
jgi:zinc protease